jgi:hypothetical protein
VSRGVVERQRAVGAAAAAKARWLELAQLAITSMSSVAAADARFGCSLVCSFPFGCRSSP